MSNIHSGIRSEFRDVDGEQKMRATVGSTRVEEELFAKAFDGRVMSRLWAFVAPFRMRLWIAVAAVLTFTGSQLAIPLIVRYAVDRGLAPGGHLATDRTVLGWCTAVFALVVIINFFASRIQEGVVGSIAEGVLFGIRRAMFRHLQYVSLKFMDKTEVGRLMSRLQGDVNAMQEFLETSVIAVGDFALLIGIVIAMLWLNLVLGIVVLAVLPVLFIARIFWLKYARVSFMAAHEANSVANGALAEAIHGVRTVQAMERQDVNAGLYGKLIGRVLKTQLYASRVAQVMVPLVDTLTGIAMALVVIVGGSMVANGKLDIGVMLAFMFYVQRFFDPIRSLTLQYSVMQRAMASGHRLIEVLDVEIDVEDKPDAKPLGPDDDGEVVFDHVTFGYNPKDPVLKDVSFTVKSGETVALVGPTGSGKSSAMSLVHRFYDVDEGRVLVGGHDVRDVTQASLGRHIAMVLQEPYLFTGTAFENIRYSTPGVTDEQIIAAAKAVGAHDFLSALPHGYNTILEERGGNLSQGQRQLVSFARALVADARILVLDEATANIDSHTERQIQAALEVVLKGRTGMVIAHRLATIRNADRIIVLRKGEIVEQGTHDELIAKKGLYDRLYSFNYASFDDIAPEDIDPASAS